MEIGEKIKSLRKKMDLTQEELANRSELTKGFISQLERDLNSPSVDSLSNVLEALGTNLSDFFSDIEEEQIVFKEEDFFVGTNEKLHHTMEWIVPNSVKNSMDPVLLTLSKDGQSEKYPPNEGEEFGYVLEGEINLHYGQEVFQVESGETFYVNCDKERYIENNKNKTAKVLWISNPPSF